MAEKIQNQIAKDNQNDQIRYPQHQVQVLEMDDFVVERDLLDTPVIME
jgi:hypothetical protein